MMTSNDDRPELRDGLPEELLYEIFVRLPVKSLTRFRSVSKGMLQLIDSSSFIKKNNNLRSRSRSRSGPDSDDDDEEYGVVLYSRKPLGYYLLNFDNLNLNRAKAIKLNCNFVFKGERRINVMDYCCNGVFFITKRGKWFVFWNPSNGTFRKVDCSSCLPSFIKTSMGYDTVTDDYKIIGFIENEAAALQIYSLRNNSWTKLVFHPNDFPSGRPCDVPFSVTNAVCLSGVIHWIWTTNTHAHANTDEKCSIVAFNLATETFTSLPLPPRGEGGLLLRMCHFTDCRGRLCLTFRPPGYPDPSTTNAPHTIWVMEEYGVETSWSKLYNFNKLFASYPNFYFLPNNTGRLLCYNSQWCWCWWDPQQGTYQRIEIPGVAMVSAIAHVYVRNLVRLDDHSLV